MNTFIPKAFLFTSWTLMSGWLLSDQAFFFASQEKQFQLLIGFFLLFLGSFIFLRQPIKRTIRNHLYTINQKLGTTSALTSVVKAIELGVVQVQLQ